MKKSLGVLIAERRKEKGMTQAQPAKEMGVTDKAVSKWALSCPDINFIPKLAELLGVTAEQLMKGQSTPPPAHKNVQDSSALVLRAIPAAMGITVVVLAILNQPDTKSGLILPGIGLASVGLSLLREKK